MKAGLVGSHAVYPLASNVALIPPEGKLDIDFHSIIFARDFV